MLEKFIQAALITFLLHLMVQLNINTQIPGNRSSMPATPSSIISLVLRSFK
ncbi:hypothetical protein VB711_11225 [Cronbergia sp. UHCC 0137]|uniref:hypothetical protein n=1 Tax=Cronbergia sp. UHCC 0137 TaxID=3110239 RepID=UPI002B1EF04E|nr:hypothetical protein [Cronbergia sp. UHCC 0137]MEA5618405.1 hypothetical protein [Cronbergia sp. UHCC 0137]